MKTRWIAAGLVMFCGFALNAAPPAGPTNEQKTAAAQVAMGNLAAALEAFKTDNGRYPRTNEGLRSLLEKPNTLPKWKGPYAKGGAIALIDPWKRPFVFKCPGTDPKGFDLSSNGPDGKPASGDDVVYVVPAPAK